MSDPNFHPNTNSTSNSQTSVLSDISAFAQWEAVHGMIPDEKSVSKADMEDADGIRVDEEVRMRREIPSSTADEASQVSRVEEERGIWKWKNEDTDVMSPDPTFEMGNPLDEFDIDPSQKEFFEELLHVAPQEELSQLSQLSISATISGKQKKRKRDSGDKAEDVISDLVSANQTSTILAEEIRKTITMTVGTIAKVTASLELLGYNTMAGGNSSNSTPAGNAKARKRQRREAQKAEVARVKEATMAQTIGSKIPLVLKSASIWYGSDDADVTEIGTTATKPSVPKHVMILTEEELAKKDDNNVTEVERKELQAEKAESTGAMGNGQLHNTNVATTTQLSLNVSRTVQTPFDKERAERKLAKRERQRLRKKQWTALRAKDSSMKLNVKVQTSFNANDTIVAGSTPKPEKKEAKPGDRIAINPPASENASVDLTNRLRASEPESIDLIRLTVKNPEECQRLTRAEEAEITKDLADTQKTAVTSDPKANLEHRANLALMREEVEAGQKILEEQLVGASHKKVKQIARSYALPKSMMNMLIKAKEAVRVATKEAHENVGKSKKAKETVSHDASKEEPRKTKKRRERRKRTRNHNRLPEDDGNAPKILQDANVEMSGIEAAEPADVEMHNINKTSVNESKVPELSEKVSSRITAGASNLKRRRRGRWSGRNNLNDAVPKETEITLPDRDITAIEPNENTKTKRRGNRGSNNTGNSPTDGMTADLNNAGNARHHSPKQNINNSHISPTHEANAPAQLPLLRIVDKNISKARPKPKQKLQAMEKVMMEIEAENVKDYRSFDSQVKRNGSGSDEEILDNSVSDNPPQVVFYSPTQSWLPVSGVKGTKSEVGGSLDEDEDGDGFVFNMVHGGAMDWESGDNYLNDIEDEPKPNRPWGAPSDKTISKGFPRKVSKSIKPSASEASATLRSSQGAKPLRSSGNLNLDHEFDPDRSKKATDFSLVENDKQPISTINVEDISRMLMQGIEGEVFSEDISKVGPAMQAKWKKKRWSTSILERELGVVDNMPESAEAFDSREDVAPVKSKDNEKSRNTQILERELDIMDNMLGVSEIFDSQEDLEELEPIAGVKLSGKDKKRRSTSILERELGIVDNTPETSNPSEPQVSSAATKFLRDSKGKFVSKARKTSPKTKHDQTLLQPRPAQPRPKRRKSMLERELYLLSIEGSRQSDSESENASPPPPVTVCSSKDGKRATSRRKSILERELSIIELESQESTDELKETPPSPEMSSPNLQSQARNVNSRIARNSTVEDSDQQASSRESDFLTKSSRPTMSTPRKRQRLNATLNNTPLPQDQEPQFDNSPKVLEDVSLGNKSQLSTSTLENPTTTTQRKRHVSFGAPHFGDSVETYEAKATRRKASPLFSLAKPISAESYQALKTVPGILGRDDEVSQNLASNPVKDETFLSRSHTGSHLYEPKLEDEDEVFYDAPEMPALNTPERRPVGLIPKENNDEQADSQKTAKKEKVKRPPAKSPYFRPLIASPAKKRESTEALEPRTPKKNSRESPEKLCRPGGTVSSIPFPPITRPYFGLIQEKLAHTPFRLLIAVTFLIKTNAKHAIPAFYEMMGTYPTAEQLAEAKKEDLVEIVRHLGLQNQRATTYQTYAKMWLEDPPTKGKRYAVRGYPTPNSGRDIPKGTVIDDSDPREAWEIAHMTNGPYAIDSWRIFCRDIFRGLSTGWNGEDSMQENFQPEWMRVLPEDKELKACLRWMWLKEGFVWDPATGDKDVADRELMEAAIKGSIVWDDDGGLRIVPDEENVWLDDKVIEAPDSLVGGLVMGRGMNVDAEVAAEVEEEEPVPPGSKSFRSDKDVMARMKVGGLIG